MNQRMVEYRKVSWKYILTDPQEYRLKMPMVCPVETPWYRLESNAVYVKRGYAWDGASGPTVDTQNSMRATLLHDVLYQAMREGHLPKRYRRKADAKFRRILKTDGMEFLRRWAWWYGVRLFGKSAARGK